MSEKKLLKSEKIRLKNDALRAKGKDPLKGWGKMIDTGLGGLNKVNTLDTKDYVKDLQRNIAKDVENKNK